jgi:hypothetical protein
MFNGHGALKLVVDDVCPATDCVAALVVALKVAEPVVCNCAVTNTRLGAAADALDVLWAEEVLLIWAVVLLTDDTINVGVAFCPSA